MKLLLAEDEKDMSSVLSALLIHAGYEVDVADNGQIAVDLAATHSYDCMILDIMMPIKDGITALKEIRASGDTTPVIMLTAKSQVEDRIDGLDSGADDYLTKPFSVSELLARIRALTRRTSQTLTPTKITAGSVSLNTEEQELSCHNSIRLNHKETRLMKLFMMNIGKDMDSMYLFNTVWNDEPDMDKSIVYIYISYLREKLHAINANLEISGDKDGPFTLKVVEK